MKQAVTDLLKIAIGNLEDEGIMENIDRTIIDVQRTRDNNHGDFASNLALKFAKQARMSPRDLARKIVQVLPQDPILRKTEIAGPGFINFFLTKKAYLSLISTIQQQDDKYGRSNKGKGKSVIVEFVSSNPTGPLHVGHGRGAAVGDSLARILRACGYQTYSEYYINDAGRQVDILALSVWLRYLQHCQKLDINFPDKGYQGDYIIDIVQTLQQKYGDSFHLSSNQIPEKGEQDEEQHIDELVAYVKQALDHKTYKILFNYVRDTLVGDIRQDLEEFGVVFNNWFSERDLVEQGDVDESIKVLNERGYLFKKEGATWFRSTDFGDEKDRVVIRENGEKTYFASDIAYHYNKVKRGFDKIINIFGADHHGYIDRIYASFEALGSDRQRLQFLLVQFAVLYRGKQKVSMSTRSGEFVTLRELRKEVGNDAARFFYALRKSDQHMDFDLDLAKSQSSDNPVYYVQYAHARICSVFRQLEERNLPTLDNATPNYTLLTESREIELLVSLSRFPEVVELAGDNYELHQIGYYLRDLANDFHGYYNAHPFLGSEEQLRLARLGLIDAARIVFANGLSLLGVSAPISM